MDTQVIEVRLWGRRVGAVAPDPRLGCYVFAFDPAWRKTGIELAPLTMPLNDTRQSFAFPELAELSYKRLPGLLADALPDDFGNALIDAWMSAKGVETSAVTPLDRLA
jgi:serine/threonine-protein kinase HipA